MVLQQERSCADVLGSHPLLFDITWDTGEVSHVDGTAVTTQVNSTLVVTRTGEVESGPFEGMQYRHVAE